MPPIVTAILSGDELRSLQLAKDPAFDPKKEYFGARPIHLAAEYGQTKVVAALLQIGPDTIDSIDATGATPLMWAVMNSHQESIELLLKNGADPLAPEKLKSRGHEIYSPKNALWWCIHNNDKDSSVSLLEELVAVGDLDNSSRIIKQAIEENREAIFRLLVESGKFAIQWKEETEALRHPLVVASQFDRLGMIQIISNHFGKEEIQKSPILPAAVVEAAEANALKSIEFLIEELGASPALKVGLSYGDATDPFGGDNRSPRTPLRAAINHSRTEMIAYLLARGVEPEIEDLFAAINRKDSAKPLGLLIPKVKDINDFHNRKSLLMQAVQKEAISCAKMLLKNGADPEQQDEDGKSVLDHAVETENRNLIDLIKNAIKDSSEK